MSKTANQHKSNRNAAGRLPVEGFRRRFVIVQIQVKARYRLSVTEPEAVAMRTVVG